MKRREKLLYGLKAITLGCLILFIHGCEKRKSAAAVPIQSQANTPPTNTDSIPVINTHTVGFEIGDIAPDITTKDSNNVAVKLSSLRGKTVLLDFWASWCAPCRIENKKLIGIYTKYRDTTFKSSEGFEIYSVSVDERREGWINRIIREKYNWKYNLFDEERSAAATYQIKSIPTNYLLDANGIIIAKNLRDSIVEKTLIQLLK